VPYAQKSCGSNGSYIYILYYIILYIYYINICIILYYIYVKKTSQLRLTNHTSQKISNDHPSITWLLKAWNFPKRSVRPTRLSPLSVTHSAAVSATHSALNAAVLAQALQRGSHTLFLMKHAGWGPSSLGKLVYNYNNSVWYLYLYLDGVINQQTFHWGAPSCDETSRGFWIRYLEPHSEPEMEITIIDLRYPLVNIQKNIWKITIFNGFLSTINGHFQ